MRACSTICATPNQKKNASANRNTKIALNKKPLDQTWSLITLLLKKGRDCVLNECDDRGSATWFRLASSTRQARCAATHGNFRSAVNTFVTVFPLQMQR